MIERPRGFRAGIAILFHSLTALLFKIRAKVSNMKMHVRFSSSCYLLAARDDDKTAVSPRTETDWLAMCTWYQNNNTPVMIALLFLRFSYIRVPWPPTSHIFC